MSIDFFTFFAQMFNLLLLLYLLRRFLYLPVLKAVEERQKFIERELKKAASSHKQALQLEEECRQKMAEIEVQKQEILSRTRSEAQELAEKLTKEAQHQFVVAQKQWKQRLQNEQQTFERAVQALLTEHFKSFAVSALKQMAGVSLNDLMLAKLQEKIKNLPQRKKQEFAAAYQLKKHIEIVSAPKLQPQQRRQVTAFLQEQFELPVETKFKFVTDEKLVCGVAIQAEDQLIEWNFAAFLTEFRKHVDNDVQQLVNKG
ncbi:MAG: F0F1 ATP synthase subunit delta [Pseudomonadota bacterium]|nr:F0F1 ATP synthase subunit delta [Pseudomonadota bacterium]